MLVAVILSEENAYKRIMYNMKMLLWTVSYEVPGDTQASYIK